MTTWFGKARKNSDNQQSNRAIPEFLTVFVAFLGFLAVYLACVSLEIALCVVR
jgi:hypothetical protein